MNRGVHGARVDLDGFTAPTSIAVGIALAAGREGGCFPTGLLRGTTFRGNVAPGLILAVVVGGSATVPTMLTLRDSRLGAYVSALAGKVLLGWIVGEFSVVRAPEARS